MNPSNASVAHLPALVPLSKAAEFLTVDVRTVRRWAASGRLRVVKFGAAKSARVVIPRAELARLLDDCTVVVNG